MNSIPRRTVILLIAGSLCAAVLIAIYLHSRIHIPRKTVLTAEERVWLQSNADKLVLYYDWKFPPMEFLSPQGNFDGMGADVIKALEKRLGIQFHKQVSKDWSRHLESLKNGESAVAPVIVNTPERQSYLYFTAHYTEVPVVIITSQSLKGKWTLDQLKGRKVAVINEFATEEYLRRNYTGHFDIIEVKNVQEGLRDVSFGVVDALVENIAVASYYIEKEGLSNLRVAGNTDYSFKFSIAVSRHYPLLYSALDRSFRDITRKEFSDIQARWIHLQSPGFISEDMIRILKIGGLFIVALIISLAVFSFILKRRLNKEVLILEKTQESLRESEALSRAIMDQSFQLIVLLDREGKILILNKKALDFISMPFESTAGLLFWDGPWWKKKDQAREIISVAVDKALAGEVVRSETRIRDFQGVEYYIDFSVSPIVDKTGNVVYIIVEGRDVTDRKHVEMEKERLTEQLVQAQKMDALGQLAGGIAHDFNNMLATISGSAELLSLRCADDPKKIKLCRNILVSSQRAGELTRKLLAFSRKINPVLSPVDIFAIIEETAAILKSSIDRRITVKTVKNAERTVVMGDSSQIHNALLNLGINARDAMPDGGEIVFSVEERDIVPGESDPEFDLKPGKYLRIRVSDTGVGMAPELVSRIFEPFFTTKEVGKGTGLGLAAVYGTVREHHGSIMVKSSQGRGSEFIIDLPLAEKQIIRKGKEMSPPRGTGKVLFIDDEDILRSTAGDLLEDLGYTPVMAANGSEGVEIFSRLHAELYAVICDMIMPVMSGGDALRAIREIDATVPTIICSGFHMDSNDRLVKENLADAFLRKPFTGQELGNALASVAGLKEKKK